MQYFNKNVRFHQTYNWQVTNGVKFIWVHLEFIVYQSNVFIYISLELLNDINRVITDTLQDFNYYLKLLS